MKKIRFIINPYSGIWLKRHFGLKKDIYDILDKDVYKVKIKLTKHAGHAIKLSDKCHKKHIDIAVAVGGDGSVNEVSRSLVNSEICLGIVPTGSGNGLARYLGIPLNVRKAISVINAGKVRKIDTVRLNDVLFVNCAGIGFDAYIAKIFQKNEIRGVLTYLNIVITRVTRYRSREYNMVIDGKPFQTKAFLISFANSSQFGNNVHIAPGAQIDDGLLDLAIFKPFPWYAVPSIAYMMFHPEKGKSKYTEIIRCKQVQVINEGPIQVHIDGEPVEIIGNLEISVNPGSLKVIVP